MATAKTRFSASSVTAPDKAQSNRIKPSRVRRPRLPGGAPRLAMPNRQTIKSGAKRQKPERRLPSRRQPCHLIRRGSALPQANANGLSEAVRHPRRLGSRRSADGRYAHTRFSCDFCHFDKLKTQGLPRGGFLRPIIRPAASFLAGYCAIVCSDWSNYWLSYLASMKTRPRMSRTKCKPDEDLLEKRLRDGRGGLMFRSRGDHLEGFDEPWAELKSMGTRGRIACNGSVPTPRCVEIQKN